MKVKVRDLRNPNFGKAMMKLDKCDKWPSIAAVKRFAELSETIGKVYTDNTKELGEHTLSFAKVDDEGNPVLDDKGGYVIEDEKKGEYAKMVGAFYDGTVDVNIEGIREKDLQTVGITPEDWSTIKWLVR